MAEKYEMYAHNPAATISGKKYCVHCGLVYLNNEFTRWAIQKGCDNKNHPQYQTMRSLTSIERN